MPDPDPGRLDLLARLMHKTIAGSGGAGRTTADVGMFVGAVHDADDLVWLSYALPKPDATPDRFDPADVAALQKLFAGRGRVLRFEFFEPLHPWLAARLAGCGLKLQGAMPMMVCGPADLRPVAAAGVEVRPLAADDSDLLLSSFLVTAKLCFGEPPAATPQEVEATRQNLRDGVYRSAYATVDGAMAGVGSVSAANDELVGIGTLPGYRRRGVAATVSSRLVADHFAAGASLAWLSAGDGAAHATYRKIGFQPVGMQLNYIEGTWDGRTRAGMAPGAGGSV